jgi:RNA polymerase sigma factor (sigma-70 family)
MAFELTGPEGWRLWNVAVRFLRWARAEDAEDLASETVVRLLQNLRRGEQILNPESYVRQVARNVLHEDRRARRFEVQLSAGAPAPDTGTDTETAEVMSQCLGKCKKKCLSKQERVLIEAYYGGDPSRRISRRKDLADKMGLSENALRLAAFRVRRRLSECMEECLGIRPRQK